jgi:hypothetical protein
MKWGKTLKSSSPGNTNGLGIACLIDPARLCLKSVRIELVEM